MFILSQNAFFFIPHPNPICWVSLHMTSDSCVQNMVFNSYWWQVCTLHPLPLLVFEILFPHPFALTSESTAYIMWFSVLRLSQEPVINPWWPFMSQTPELWLYLFFKGFSLRFALESDYPVPLWWFFLSSSSQMMPAKFSVKSGFSLYSCKTNANFIQA
jgi:hypothetical protein